ncbi:hypothetical protein GCM10010912_27170 [Paenibacillus albidus]|uniref:GH26 domain-containing protein n=1 Tax=Paenibacillus albidus TaxID=2041023 RepID=A0A917CDC5_9BACL|nr:hypothetical protein GCM10010912_27170 [Paenibacillus albidus]
MTPTPVPTAAPTEEPGANIRVVTLADADATPATRSLFAYLQDIRGKHVLFGHQHATDEALSAPVGNVTSDTYSVVGDHPAMFGWDTLSLEGFEKPGLMTNTPEQNRDNLVAAMKQAYESGGVLALSSHMPNFVTGKDFYDTSGNVVSHILPGGDKHEEFNLFLDKIADFALHLKDDDGNFIPVIFRPFHEQNGGWFWWGAPYTTKEQYIEIYRYTEEYLRDVKGVHNFLYAFSPGSPFNSLEETFLKTYPGDDYVDILGFDTYYDGNNQGWFNTVVDDARLISKLADARGKVAAFTEFGYSNVKPTETADKAFFTKLIAALQSDPDAKRMAYMLTWANFNYESIFVPYRGSVQHGDHELLPDFEQYYDDPYTYFSQDLTNVYNQEVIAAAKKPSMHIVSPTGQETIRTNTTTVRAKVLDQQPSKVVFVTAGSAGEHEMTLNDQGFYAAEWQPTADLNGKSTELTVRVYAADQSVQEETVKIYFGVPEIILKQFTFDQDIAGIQSHGAYPVTIGSDFSHISLEGDGKLAIGVSDLVYTDSWQELKAGLPGIAESVNLQWVNRVSFDVWVPLAAGAKDESANLRAAVELPPSSDKSVTADAAKLADLERISVNGAVYGKYSAVIDLSSSAQIEAATGLSFAIIGSGLQYDGPIYVDNIQLINAYTGESNDPAWVDDFESYKSSDDLLRASYSPNGDTNTIELNTEHAQNGQYALKLDYTLAGQGYTGITKNLGSRDWSGTGKIKFWLVPDASGKKMVVQIKANDISFEYYPSLEDTIPRWVEIPFKDFTTAPWDSANTGKKLDAVNAKNVQAFSIYVNALSGDSYSKDHPFSSTLYIDQIQAVAWSPGDIPDGAEGGTTPPGEAVEPGTLYGFESDTMGWNVEQNFAEATSLSLTSDAYAEGVQAVETGFNLALTSFEVAKYAELNLSGLKTLSAELKLSSGAANVYLYVKTGSGWTWQDKDLFGFC